MLRTFRRSLGVPAGLFMVLLTMGVALPAALHGEATDDACEAIGSGPSADFRLQGDSSLTPEQHCSICHWLRSLRVFQTGAAQPLPRLVPSAGAVPRAGCVAPRLVLDPSPARAPPA